MEESRLGIVILNYNTWRETLDCVASVIRYTNAPYKVYVVDNNSSDDSLEKLKWQYKNKENITVIETGENRGYSAGNNVGIRKAIDESCNIIFIMNSDVELLNDAFSQMTKTLLSDESFMMVGPSIRDNSGKEAQIPRKKLTFKCFFFARHPFCDIPIFAKLASRCYPVKESEIFVFDGSASGCCFGVRAKDFTDMGYLDENVFLYSEEDILAYKMGSRDKKAVVEGQARVWHKENVSTKKEGNAFVQFHRWNSALYMLKRYAKIGKVCQLFIALWNTLTWTALSIVSDSHRKMLKDFYKYNWGLVLQKKDD